MGLRGKGLQAPEIQVSKEGCWRKAEIVLLVAGRS